jgi:hypothetical protein
MDLDLNGRVAVVTGASKGSGAGGPPPGTSLPRFGFLDLSDVAWRRSRPPAVRCQRRLRRGCPGPVRTPWWTDERGAADILALSPHAASTTGTEVVVDSGMMKT